MAPAKPQSILKKPPNSSIPEAPAAHDRHRALAHYHANLIQHRKDVEAAIFASLELLLDAPTAGPGADPQRPSAHDIAQAQHHLRLFQPADYDSLIEERNIDGRCGYVLCPRPRRRQPSGAAKFRLIPRSAANATRTGIDEAEVGSGPLRVVSAAELEKWCCDDCGMRALYIRVQLSEYPAWERTDDGAGTRIVIHGMESGASSSDRTRLSAMATQEVERLGRGLEQLALERGNGLIDPVTASTISNDIQERAIVDSTGPRRPSNIEDDGENRDHGQGRESRGDEIEGYAPQMRELQRLVIRQRPQSSTRGGH